MFIFTRLDGLQSDFESRGHGLVTSARIVLEEELFEGAPAAADADHDRRPEDPDQAKLLGIAELGNKKAKC